MFHKQVMNRCKLGDVVSFTIPTDNGNKDVMGTVEKNALGYWHVRGMQVPLENVNVLVRAR